MISIKCYLGKSLVVLEYFGPYLLLIANSIYFHGCMLWHCQQGDIFTSAGKKLRERCCKDILLDKEYGSVRFFKLQYIGLKLSRFAKRFIIIKMIKYIIDKSIL